MAGMDFSKVKIVCLIPARGGSKGVPHKNIRDFRGKPLIAWTIGEAKKSSRIDRVAVSTEDGEIARISNEYGAEVIERPDELAQDSSTSMDVVLHALNKLKETGYDPDYVMLLQCTSPLRTAGQIDEAVESLISNADRADSLISVVKEEHSPWWMKKINGEGHLVDLFEYDKTHYARRQDFPDVYRLNGAIYLAKTGKFREYKEFETDRVMPYVMDVCSSLDIDAELDFRIGEYLSELRL